jgi:hypothetical protein
MALVIAPSVTVFCDRFRTSVGDLKCLNCRASGLNEKGKFTLRCYYPWSSVVPELDGKVEGLPALCEACRKQGDRIKTKLFTNLKFEFGCFANDYEETAEEFARTKKQFCIDPVFYQLHKTELLGSNNKPGKLWEWQTYGNAILKQKWMWTEVEVEDCTYKREVDVSKKTTLRILGLSPYQLESILIPRSLSGDKLAHDMLLDGLETYEHKRLTRTGEKQVRRTQEVNERVRILLFSGKVDDRLCVDLIRFETGLRKGLYEVYANNLEIMTALESPMQVSVSSSACSLSSGASCSSSSSSSFGSSSGNYLALEAPSASPASSSVVAAITEPGKPNGAGSLEVGVAPQPGVPNGAGCLGENDKIMRGGDGGGDAAPKESESYKARGDSKLES